MTLIDTPGLNDPDQRRSDKNIHIEIIKSLSISLYDPQQGISSLILCVMPNASQRITDSTIKGLNSMLFMFNYLDERIDISMLPKLHIIINNVSKHGDIIDIDQVERDPSNSVMDPAIALKNEKRIEDLKFQITEGAKSFYLVEKVSDATRIGQKTWREIKREVIEGHDFSESSWF